MEKRTTRRKALQGVGAIALAASVKALNGEELDSRETGFLSWEDDLYQAANSLKIGNISALGWQEAMDHVYSQTRVDSLKKQIRFDLLCKEILKRIPAGSGEYFHRIHLRSKSAPTQRVESPRMLITKVAHIKKGRSIPPHGHSNMASAFLCISGEFHVRQFDKIEDRNGHLVIRQTLDQKRAGVGTWSSISDYRNNIHWLTAMTDDCFLFTSKLIGIEEGRTLNGRINVDVRRGEQLGANTIRAPRISAKEAKELY